MDMVSAVLKWKKSINSVITPALFHVDTTDVDQVIEDFLICDSAEHMAFSYHSRVTLHIMYKSLLTEIVTSVKFCYFLSVYKYFNSSFLQDIEGVAFLSLFDDVGAIWSFVWL